MIGWAAVVFSIQNWLGETPEQAKKAGTPAYLSVGMSLMAVMVVRFSSVEQLYPDVNSLTPYRLIYLCSCLRHHEEEQTPKLRLLYHYRNHFLKRSCR